MKLHEIDILIICAYLIAMIVIGLILKKRAAQNMDSYFLGGKSLPFYMLGLSNASGMFDITGTMLMVYWAFAYGFKSPIYHQHGSCDGILGICLRIQKPLDSLVVASIQPNLSNGLSVRVVTSFQCTHRSGMD